MKKYIISLLLFLAITTKVSSLGDDFKNSLTKIDLKKVDDSTYQVELFVQNPYFEPVKVVKRSETSYYILLPETKTNISASTSNSDITSIDVKSFPYMGQSVNNGYTKVALTTSKPITFTSKVFSENDSKFAKIDTNKLAQIDNTNISAQNATSTKVNLKPSAKPETKTIASAKPATVAVAKVESIKTVKQAQKAPANKVKVAKVKTKKIATTTQKQQVAKIAPAKKQTSAKAVKQTVAKSIKPQTVKKVEQKPTSVKIAQPSQVAKIAQKPQGTKTVQKQQVAAAAKIPDEIINEPIAKIDETGKSAELDKSATDLAQRQTPLGMREIIKKNILLIIASLAFLTALFATILNKITQREETPAPTPAKKKDDEALGLLKIKEEAKKDEILENAIKKNEMQIAQNETVTDDTPKSEYEFSELLENDVLEDNAKDSAKFELQKEPDSSLKTRLDISKLKGEDKADEASLEDKLEIAKAKLDSANVEKANRLKQIRDKKRQVDEILEGGASAVNENEIEVSLDEIVGNGAKPKAQIQNANTTNAIGATRKTYYNDNTKDYANTAPLHPRGTFLAEREQAIRLDRVEVQSPIKNEPANRGDEAKILSSIEVENDRGFYIASYNGREVLAGHIEDEVFIICAFKEKLKNYNLAYRLLDSALERDYYMIKVDDKKIIVKSTTEKLKLEAKVR